MAFAITITPTQTLLPANDLDGDGVVDPGETVTTKLLISNVGTVDALALTVADTLNGFDLVPGTLKVTPIAFDDVFAITGNTPITFTAAQLTGNDVDPDGGATPTLSVGIVGTATNGAVVDNGNGTFTFTPNTGFNGTASFEYLVADAQGLSSVSPATVTLTVSGKVWYVDSAYGGANGASDGSYLRPFTNITPLNNAASDVDGAGDTIFVYNRGTAYTGGLVLEDGQSLIGDGVAYAVNGGAIGVSGANATISTTATFGIQLGANNTIRGITVDGTAPSATGMQDGNASVGTLTIANSSITGTGKAIDIDQGGTLAVQFDTLSSSGSTSEGIHLQGLSGSFATTTGTIQGAANQGVLIGHAGGAVAGSGGTIAFTYGGAVTNNGTTVAGIEIQDHTAGAIGFTGAISDTTGPGILVDTNAGALSFGGAVTIASGAANGVTLTNNTGAISFAGTGTGLDITTASGTGLTFTGGGSLTIAGADNSITTATGALANLGGTVAAGGIAFSQMTVTGVATGNAFTATNLDGGAVTIGTMTIAGAAGDGINVSGGSDSAFTIGTATINGVGGDGIEINGSTGAFTLNGGAIGNTNDPAGDGVNVTGGTGAVTIGASITKTTAGNVVEVNNHDGGAVVFSGNLSATGGVANGILVTNTNAGSVNFSGGNNTLSTGTNTAVDLQNNAGATIGFGGGGLTIATTSGTGFNAIGGGSVGVSGGGNSVTTTTGTAVNVTATTSTGITWQSVNTNNADIGINLQNTGAGAFTVTGNGATDSGGSIRGATTGINLLNTGALNLTQVNIVGDTTSDDGIFGQNVAGLMLTNVDISGSQSSGQVTDRGVEMTGLTGVATVTNSTFTNMPGHLFHVKNATGTLNLTITGSTFSGSQATGAGGDDGILIENDGTSSIAARITGSSFSNNEGDHIQWAGNGTGVATGNLTISGNSFSTTTPGDALSGGGITISPAGASLLTTLVQDNTMTGSLGAAITVSTAASTAGGLVQASILSNRIGTAGAINSGSREGNGITVASNGDGALTARVDGNTVRGVSGNYGIEIVNRGGTLAGGGTVNATVTNNSVADVGTGTLSAIRVVGGSSLASDTGSINLDIGGNAIDLPANAQDLRITSNGDVNLFFLGLGGASVTGGSNAATIKTYLEARNPGAETASLLYNTNENTALWGSTTTVATPALPASPLLAVADAPVADPAPAATPVAESAALEPVAEAPAAPTDAPAAPAPAPAHPVIVDDGVLSAAELAYLVDAAIARWAAAGASEAQIAAMRATDVTVTNMTGPYLGLSDADGIAIDADGAGHGWFLDTTPGDDAEFTGQGSRLTATDGGGAAGKVDLLTTLMHELGHRIGLTDLYATGDAYELMYGYIVAGERRTPAAEDLANAGAAPIGHSAFAIAPVGIGKVPAGKAVEVSFDAVAKAPTPGLATPITNTTTVSGDNFSSVTASRALTTDTLTLGDRVFVDANGNGRFDVGEGVSGVALSLFVDTNGNGALDGAEATNAIASATTGADGAYSFAGLNPGNYAVRVDAGNFAAGAVLAGRVSLVGGTDPDDDVDGDDNGVAGTGGATISGLITLALGTETTADATGKRDINTALDFGFVTPNVAPTATGLSGDSVTYVEGAAAVRLDAGANATIADAAANFAGGSLTVAIGAGRTVGEDVLGIATTASVTATATTVSVNSAVIATYTGGGLGASDLVFTFTAAATPTAVGELLRALTYRNINDANPSGATRTIGYTLVDGDGTQGGLGTDTLVLTSSVAVTPVDDLPTAVADVAATDEASTRIIDVLTNDPDVDGGTKGVTAINGTAIAVGGTVTLANSKATVTLLADGTLRYAPNGQFDWLVSSAKAGTNPAFASSATETFGYTLNGGSTTAVTVTILGLDGAGDQLRGTAGVDTITGTDADDVIDLAGGGSDVATGGLGNDAFFLGAALDTGDRIDGGPGTLDQLGLRGNYATQLVLGPDTVRNVEMLVFLPGNDTRFGGTGTATYSYNIKTDDATVAANTQMIVQANALRAGETLTFDGSAETNGSFLTYGGLGTDILTGGAKDDGFYFGQDRFNATDRVTGGAGTDQLGLQGDYSGGRAIAFGANQLSSVEMIVLLSGADSRFGGGLARFNYWLTMDDGNAVGTGPMTVQGNALRADEVLILDASREASTPYVVYGGAARDTITGGGGNDEIWGRGGGDTLRGGAGNDVFAYFDATDSFGTGATRDTILDFARGDRIDVSRAGLNSFVGAGPFTAAGQIRVTGSGTSWLVEGDVNGDGTADLSIAVTTTTSGFAWAATDFRTPLPPVTEAPSLAMDSHAFLL